MRHTYMLFHLTPGKQGQNLLIFSTLRRHLENLATRMHRNRRPHTTCFLSVCRLSSLFSWRVLPSKFVFLARVAFEVCFLGVCRLPSLFSWRMSLSKLVFLARVAFEVCFLGVCRLPSLFSWRVSPSKFVFYIYIYIYI